MYFNRIIYFIRLKSSKNVVNKYNIALLKKLKAYSMIIYLFLDNLVCRKMIMGRLDSITAVIVFFGFENIEWGSNTSLNFSG